VGSHGLALELQHGTSLGRSGWVTAGAGYRWLSAPALNSVVFGMAQIGRRWNSGFELEFHVPFQFSMGPIDELNLAGTGNTEYVGFGVGPGWWFAERVGVAAAVEGVGYAAANRGAPALSLAVQLAL